MAWGAGRGPSWSKIRARVLRRDPTCRLRFTCCTIRSTQVDHIVNLANGGTHDLDNLQGTCKPCHAVKTKLEAAAGRTKRAKAKRSPEAHPGFISPEA